MPYPTHNPINIKRLSDDVPVSVSFLPFQPHILPPYDVSISRGPHLPRMSDSKQSKTPNNAYNISLLEELHQRRAHHWVSYFEHFSSPRQRKMAPSHSLTNMSTSNTLKPKRKAFFIPVLPIVARLLRLSTAAG